MKFTFITNYLTHHQLPFCLEMVRRLGNDFKLIATNSMEEERLHMGWGLNISDYDFVIQTDEYEGECRRLMMESDAVMCGGASAYYVLERMDAGKLTFRYHERLYKNGQIHAFAPRGYIKKLKEHTKYRNSPVYLLCAGAYVPSDFSLFFSYPGKMFEWGYFPECIKYSEEELKRPERERLKLLWTGRMLKWKHPDTAVRAAKLLKEKYGVDFELEMIGEGECRADIEEMRKRYSLEKEISIGDFIAPAEVRKKMLDADIYLMTSDHQEGWGAVVNEAMNAGCAVVASTAAGSVPYLLMERQCGLAYPFYNSEKENAQYLAMQLNYLCTDAGLRQELSHLAYERINGMWNADVAAQRLLEFSEAVLTGIEKSWDEGPMSKAPLMMPVVFR